MDMFHRHTNSISQRKTLDKPPNDLSLTIESPLDPVIAGVDDGRTIRSVDDGVQLGKEVFQNHPRVVVIRVSQVQEPVVGQGQHDASTAGRREKYRHLQRCRWTHKRQETKANIPLYNSTVAACMRMAG